MQASELRHLLRVLVIAAVPALALARLEPVTQISFSDERAGQPLIGVGARQLGKELRSSPSFPTRFLRVWKWWSRAPDPVLQMYAVGLYAHRIGSQLALLKLKSEEQAASEELPPTFFEAICGGFAKTIVIKMAFSMSREQIAGVLVDSVQHRMGSGGSKELEALQEIIDHGCAEAPEQWREGLTACGQPRLRWPHGAAGTASEFRPSLSRFKMSQRGCAAAVAAARSQKKTNVNPGTLLSRLTRAARVTAVPQVRRLRGGGVRQRRHGVRLWAARAIHRSLGQRKGSRIALLVQVGC
jgi:hypothetical protein